MASGYRLETLRQVRQEALREAEGGLARAADARARAEDAARQAAARRDAAAAVLEARRRDGPAAGGASFRGADWQREEAYLRRLGEELGARRQEAVAAAARVAEAARVEDAAREALVSARQALEVLEKDKVRFVEGERQAAARREEAEADDLAAARWTKERGRT